MATELIQVRVDSELKESVSGILERNGLDIPIAINMYFKEIERVGGIPFSDETTASGSFPSVTVLPSADFDKLLAALDEPMPREAYELLDRHWQ